MIFRLRALFLVSLCGAVASCTGAIGGTGVGTGNGGNTGSGAGVGVAGNTGSGGVSTPGSGGTTGVAGSTGVAGTSGGLGVTLDGAPIHARYVRLTHEQWENSVRDLLQLSALPGLSSGFEGDPPGSNFTNNERRLFVTSGLWSDYQTAAESLSQQVTRDAAALSRVSGNTTVAATFIRNFGRRAFRRDLTAAEETTYGTLFSSGASIFATGNAFADGAQLVIETMLQSPHFIYRAESGPAGQPLTGYEVASKLSFLLRNTMPDNALLDAAKAGSLNTVDGIGTQAQAMLDAMPARTVFQRFHTELFGIDRYANIEKDTALFPRFNATLAADLRTADNQFFDHLYEQNLGFKDLLLSQVAFVNQATAPLYGMTATGTNLRQVMLGADRPGFFTRAGFLAYNATLRDPDPIRRGVDIMHRAMGATNFAPPDNIVITPLPETMAGQTNRERVNAHTGPGTCGASCHGTYINPLGFAFENFDAMGQSRTTDNGKPVDTTGQYLFADGSKSFTGAPSLLALMAAAPQTHQTYSARLAEFVLARDIAEKDRTFVNTLGQSSMAATSIKQMALTVIKSPAFTTRGTP
jgi:hypothetical protein